MMRKILIVDDIDANRAILKKMLGDEYDILEASDGRGALALMQRAHMELSAVLLDLAMPVMDGFEVLAAMRGDAQLKQLPVIVTTGTTEEAVEVRALSLGAHDYITKPYNSMIVKQRLRNTIHLRETAAAVNALQKDSLTGLYNREAFMQRAGAMVRSREPGHYVLSCLDLNGFKVINDQHGTEKGDQVLIFLANTLRELMLPIGGICCRIAADNFATLYPAAYMDSITLTKAVRKASFFDGSIAPLTPSIGRFVVDDPLLAPEAMYDRAAMAKASVKGRYDVHLAQYDESMRANVLRQQEIVNDMSDALKGGQFEVWFQPQFNHASCALIGAEALVRWRHPTKGLLPPGEFIPVFERNGSIYELDKYVWEQCCILLRKWLDEGRAPLPVSVNVSRVDLFHEDLVEVVAALTEKYGVSKELLRVEITETAFAQSTDRVVDVVKALKKLGFVVEIDDFGSGYSSLNVLKDVPADILKLDMRFLEGDHDSGRGGNILESIIRMAKWLGMPIIAEGVETMEQAEFLKSIGCCYMQGYLYARPMPAAEYETFFEGRGREHAMRTLETLKGLDNSVFWDPSSLDTLIFNSYVGGACVFEFNGSKVELLRANDNFARELGIHAQMSEDVFVPEIEPYLDDRNRSLLHACIRLAAGSDTEKSCELCLIEPDGSRTLCYVHLSVRVIARAGERCLLYGSVFNVTALRESERKERETYAQLMAIMNDTPGGFSRMEVGADGIAHLVYVNAGFLKLVNMTHSEVMALCGDDVSNCLHPEDRAPVRAAVRALDENSQQLHTTFRLRHGSAGYVCVMAACRLVLSESGERFLNFYYTDISEKQRAEETRRELLDNLPCGAALYRVSGHTVTAIYLNKRYCELVGRTVDDPTQASVLGAVHPQDRAAVLGEIQSAILQSRDLLCDLRLRYGDSGEVYRPFRAYGRIVPDSDGSYSIYGTFSQITEGVMPLQEVLPRVLAAIISLSDELTFAKDRNLRYLCCSRGFARMVGKEEARDIVGKTDYDLFTKEFADKYRADDLRLMKSGESISDMTERIPSSSGIPRYASTSKHLLLDSEGNAIGLYGVGRDVTEYRAAFERLQLLTNSISGGLATYELSAEGMKLLYCSDGYFTHTGYTKDEYLALAANDPTCLVFEEDRSTMQQAITTVLKDGADTFGYEYRARCKDGGYRWLSIHGVVAERDANRIVANTVKFDITARKTAEEQLRMGEEQYRAVQRQSDVFIGRYTVADRSLSMSAEAAVIFGIPEKEPDVPYAPVRRGVIAPGSAAAYVRFFESILDGKKTAAAEFECKLTAGWRWLKANASTIFTDAGEAAYAVISLTDTTELHRQAEEREALRQQAETDGMTGVYNKKATETRIRERLSERRGVPCTLLIADVDNLKTLNDTLGHPQGDRAICRLAETLETQFRETDIVGRVGGDEFIVFLQGVNHPARVQKLMASLTERISQIRIGEDDGTPLSASIGIATGESGVDSFEQLYERADRALYHTKRSSEHRFAFYSPDMEE